MEFTVQEIAKSLEAEFFGDPNIKISSIAEPRRDAFRGSIAY